MVEASVGFQCPECVAEGNKGMRQATGRFGGQVVATAWVTRALIAINVLVFLVQYGTGRTGQIENDFALVSLAVADGEYYRLFTSAFLHYGLPHLILNMWALYAVGEALEIWLGRSRFIALYLLSAFGGSVMVYWLTPAIEWTASGQPYTPATAGASGAVFGLFGAIFILSRKMNLDIRPIAFVIILNLVFTFVLSNISWQGHIGGLITGSLVAAAFAYAPKEKRTLIQWGSAIAFVVVFAVLIAVRTSALL